MIELRPHHAMCIQNFVGNGYSEAFTAEMTRLSALFRNEPETEIKLVKGSDHLCDFCPHNTHGTCESANPSVFDENVLRETGLQYQVKLTWRQLETATKPLSLYRLDQICTGCRWLSLCQEVAKDRISRHL